MFLVSLIPTLGSLFLKMWLETAQVFVTLELPFIYNHFSIFLGKYFCFHEESSCEIIKKKYI